MINTTFKVIYKGIKPNYIKPWQTGTPVSGTGSGFGVEINGKRYILTNAHVVCSTDATMQIVKWSTSKKYDAKVINISPEVDMALLTVENSFWSDVPIVPLGICPKKGEEISVVGFPNGGENASITKGIVSRVLPLYYSNAVKHLSVQIDAAVNSGNSGGPVFDTNGKIVGIAFMSTIDAQNMCHMIPNFIIKHYLEGFEKTGKFNGVCDLGIKITKLSNDTMQETYLSKDTTGVLVRRVDPTINSVLEVGDVLHTIDDVSIHNNGTIYISETYQIINAQKDTSAVYEKVPFWYIIRMKYPGDKVILTISRKGKIKKIFCTLDIGPNSLVPIMHKHVSLNYYNVQGFIFQALNKYFLDEQFFTKYLLLPYFWDTFKQFDNQEIVILSEIIPNKVTEGVKRKYVQLISIDGTIVKNLSHVKSLCESKKKVTFMFAPDLTIAVDLSIQLSKSELII